MEEDKVLFDQLLEMLNESNYRGIHEEYDKFKVLLQSDDKSKGKDPSRLRIPQSN